MTCNSYAVKASQLSAPRMANGQVHASSHTPNIHLDSSAAGIDSLAENMGRLNLRTTMQSDRKDFNKMPKQTGIPSIGTNAQSKAGNQFLYQLEDGTLLYSGSPQYTYTQYDNNHLGVPYASQYHHTGYGVLPQNASVNGPQTPRGHAWLQSQSIPPVPDLMSHRRGSWSSNEEMSPQTPAFGHWQAPIYIAGHSASAWNTPSPMSIAASNYHHVARAENGDPYLVNFWEWTQREPAIPEPVPARHSGPDGGRGSLDKILDNPDGTTNVYVRGLQPNTTDELLGLYGQRFGAIESQKAIIDHATGTCKGFGFIKYHNYIHAENCIRAFYHLGYEAKFARESHNSRLKALADPGNTNLYISNLPKLVNEDGLKNIFASVFPPETHPQYRAGSCKILKDSCGISRGVGFARFENPQICDAVINEFNNKIIGDGDTATALQVRYADTQKQKELKSQTAVKRQFKSDEYNEAVYGIPFPGFPSTSPSYQTPINANASHLNRLWIDPSPASSISPLTYATYPNSGISGPRDSSNMVALPSSRLPHPARVKIESPSVLAAAKKVTVETSEDSPIDQDPSTRNDGARKSYKSASVTSCIGDMKGSPNKSK